MTTIANAGSAPGASWAPELEPSTRPGTHLPGAAPEPAGVARLLPSRTLSITGPRSASAAKASSTAARRATSTKTAGYTAGVSSAETAFLKDPRLSIEEKLFRFMELVAQKGEKDLLAKMDEMQGRGSAGSASKSSGSSGSSSSGSSSGAAPKKSGGIWGFIKSVIPGMSLVDKVVGGGGFKSLVTQLSGPVLAAGVTALGAPFLAPLALQAGPEITGAILDGIDGGEGAAPEGPASSTPARAIVSAPSRSASTTAAATAKSSSSSASSGTTAADGKSEQLQMMELQRLMDKQKEMMSMLSNVLRSMHDTRMTSIQNLR